MCDATPKRGKTLPLTGRAPTVDRECFRATPARLNVHQISPNVFYMNRLWDRKLGSLPETQSKTRSPGRSHLTRFCALRWEQRRHRASAASGSADDPGNGHGAAACKKDRALIAGHLRVSSGDARNPLGKNRKTSIEAARRGPLDFSFSQESNGATGRSSFIIDGLKHPKGRIYLC